MWDPSLDHDLLISEFLDGYYGKASTFVRLYMDTMHAAVDETKHFLKACCVGPPDGIHKSYLTPMALLTSANAFKDGLRSLNPADTVFHERVERASMAVSYVFLWRWDELRAFAKNVSTLSSWPLAETQQGAFDDFATIYNRTGTNMITSTFKGVDALSMFHACVFGDTKLCPSGGSRGGGALYSEVVLDECATASSPHDCQDASSWTAIPADQAGGTIFKSGLSTAKSCYAMNVCDVKGDCEPVVAYGDATGSCSKAAIQNTFVVEKNGLLAHPKGFTTETCKSKAGCCVQVSPQHSPEALGTPNTTFSTLTVAACDPSNVHQQFTVESKNGKPGQIRDKLTGRCLSAKQCKAPH